MAARAMGDFDLRGARPPFGQSAISTGWDCPRAEVMVSFRPAKDETHITQLLGRMIRTPLARRIEGDDLLNNVECILPKFSKATASLVLEKILGNDCNSLARRGSHPIRPARVS